MHVHVYHLCMRTTIEIPDELREKLVAEAVRRGEKGYSSVVERALRRYLAIQATSDSRREIARRLRGSEAGTERATDANLRGSWRTGRALSDQGAPGLDG